MLPLWQFKPHKRNLKFFKNDNSTKEDEYKKKKNNKNTTTIAQTLNIMIQLGLLILKSHTMFLVGVSSSNLILLVILYKKIERWKIMYNCWYERCLVWNWNWVQGTIEKCYTYSWYSSQLDFCQNHGYWSLSHLHWVTYVRSPKDV